MTSISFDGAFDLQVNSCLEAVAIALTKLDVLGVKLQVIEVEKLEFYILSKIYLWKEPKTFYKKLHLTGATADSCLSARHWAVFGGKFKLHIKELLRGKE